jgi:2-iminoacetate synthase
MTSFQDVFDLQNWENLGEEIFSKTKTDVEEALHLAGRGSLENIKALLSPAAVSFLEPMAQLSTELTRRRFGRAIRLYIPVYLSNVCHNVCTYCGFSMGNKVPRIVLSDKEMDVEIDAVKKLGYDNVLLLTGESHEVGVAYFKEALRKFRKHFSTLSMEVQPLDESEYAELMDEGLHAVYVYQETYRRETYRQHHPKGKKSNFEYRLETPDRLGRAGIRKMGLGVLLGLEDWRTDAYFTALHLHYLSKQYWRTQYGVSFPRLRPAEGLPELKSIVTEKELFQLICAFRLFDEQLEVSLSTRERALFRDHAAACGVTSMSAGSKTQPGGYAVHPEALEQFHISDERSPTELAAMLRSRGLDPVWKDWDSVFEQKKTSALLTLV